MKRLILLASIVALAPLLQSCSSLPVTVAFYGVKALMTVTHSSESGQAYYELGRFYQTRNQLDAAAAAYERALSVEPGHVEARNALGVVCGIQGRLDLAVSHFQEAVDRAPLSAHLHNNLGRAYYLQQKYDPAVKSLERAAALEPRNARTLHNLSQAYVGAGLAEKAQQAVQAAEKLEARNTAAIRAVLGNPIVTESKTVDSEAMSQPSKAGPPETSPGGEVVLQRNDDMTLLLLSSGVYELRPVVPVSPEAAAPAVRGRTTPPDIRFRLEVSNGNSTPGLARKVSDQLKRSGLYVVRVTNQFPYRQRVTEVQFRDGYTDAAENLAARLQQRVAIVRGERLRSDIHVRLVLGNDVRDHLALFTDDASGEQAPLTVASRLQ